MRYCFSATSWILNVREMCRRLLNNSILHHTGYLYHAIWQSPVPCLHLHHKHTLLLFLLNLHHPIMYQVFLITLPSPRTTTLFMCFTNSRNDHALNLPFSFTHIFGWFNFCSLMNYVSLVKLMFLFTFLTVDLHLNITACCLVYKKKGDTLRMS